MHHWRLEINESLECILDLVMVASEIVRQIQEETSEKVCICGV